MKTAVLWLRYEGGPCASILFKFDASLKAGMTWDDLLSASTVSMFLCTMQCWVSLSNVTSKYTSD